MDQTRTQRVLRQHLQTDRLFGVESVPVGSPPELKATEENSGAANEHDEVVPPAAPTLQSEIGTPGHSLFTAAAPKAVGGPDRAAKATLLEVIGAEVRACTKCALCQGRIQTVFGEGNPDAELMFIGEGPGQTEDETGRPFVGRAGELLDKMIVAMGLKREDVYIANVVKCRPPNNRAPLPPEVDACRGYLYRQIEMIRPRVIVTLGGPATKLILQTDRGITSIRGMWSQFQAPGTNLDPIPVMPTFHPAYLLRAYTKENRAKVWSDLQKAMAVLKG